MTTGVIEIFSDIACPWCYIGKTTFTRALAEFENRHRIDVRWRAYQLAPDMPTGARRPEIDALVESKGLPREQVTQMFDHVANTARVAGLSIDFDTVISANTFDAHRLIALAGDRRDAVVGNLFRAHFADGRVIDDHEVLADIASESGLEVDARALLESDAGVDAVRADLADAASIGVTGVPFFVADRRVAVSGAQSAEVFTQLLERALP